MATTPVSQMLNRGGAFLIANSAPEDVFTPADLTDDQRLIGQTAEEFVHEGSAAGDSGAGAAQGRLDGGDAEKGRRMGLLGGAIPEEYGGAGLDKVSATVLAEKLAGYASFAVSHGGHAGIGTMPIVYFGTEEQKKKYLPKIATGEMLSCYCLSEPQAGSDALAARTRAVLSPDGKNWILNGQKMWITNGGFADVYMVFAKSGWRKIFLLHRGARHAWIFRGRGRKKDGHQGQLDGADIFREFAGAEGKSAARNRARAHRRVQYAECGRFSLGAYCLGGAKKILEASSKYAKERTAFGKRLAISA